MSDSNLISIVITANDTEPHLRRCLESVLAQTYRNLEIIVVGGKSFDDAKTIVKQYRNADNRIIFVECENPSDKIEARLTGISHATGEYLSFVNGGDYIGVDFYRLLIESAEKNESDIVLSKLVFELSDKTAVTMNSKNLPDQPLEGKSIFKHFAARDGEFGEQYTICNKLYRKSLWIKCLRYCQKLNETVPAVDDFALSFFLFYFALKQSYAENSVYYCCKTAQNFPGKDVPASRLLKSICDFPAVFRLLENFLRKADAENFVLGKFHDYKNSCLADLQKACEATQDESEKQELLREFNARFGSLTAGAERRGDFPCRESAPWNDGIEKIKKQILDPETQYVSFDMFDTLVTRPFYKPSDLFYLLDKTYEKVFDSNLSFHQMRIDAEHTARDLLHEHPEFQDITIDEIYSYINRIYDIPADICAMLENEEKQLEIKFCSPRKTVKELYDFSLYAGKKVIIISDIYLDGDTIRSILEKNGYSRYDHLFLSSHERKSKSTGDLFKAAAGRLQVACGRIFHMGDNLKSDVINARAAGLRAAYIPGTLKLFENRVEGFETGERKALTKKIGGFILNEGALTESAGYGAMTAMCANFYFDNPFRPICSESDYNADPYLIGYYALGMHLAGILNWIIDKTRGYKRILFVARDGFLVKQAYDIWTSEMGLQDTPESVYLYLSRKMLLPILLDSAVDFMNLPIDWNKYTPSSILELLKFCTFDGVLKDRQTALRNAGVTHDLPFCKKNDYFEFMKLYLSEFYDSEKHGRAKALVREYLQGVGEGDITFDLGRLGNNQYALSRATGKPVDALFIHRDPVKSWQVSRKQGFRIKTFYYFGPAVTGLLREYMLSDPGPSCIGLKKQNGAVLPVFDTAGRSPSETFAIKKIHEGALQFIRDFCRNFRDYREFLPFKSYEVSLPFEAFLRLSKAKDLQIFEFSYFEDMVYSRTKQLNIAKVLENRYDALSLQSGEEAAALFRKIFSSIMQSSRELVCFGTGEVCKTVLAKYPELPVSFFLDNSKKRVGEYFNGKEIRHPDSIENWGKLYIIITTYYSEEISKQLTEYGLTKYKDFIDFQELFPIL